MKKIINNFIKTLGYSITKNNDDPYPDIKEKEFWEIYDLCKPYTMTSIERMYSLYCAVNYVLSHNIEGDFVECGVWRGGSSMLIAKMLSNRNLTNRDLYLYDTFEGMSEPTASDTSFRGHDAKDLLEQHVTQKETSVWCLADINDVKNNMKLTAFPDSHIFYIKGKVEDTIPQSMPKHPIALLRLDTDWYESTKHELTFLFPKIIKNGILIIDDYGHWDGCRKAVDEYFQQENIPILFHRIDYTGRIAVKTY